jgi:hypothetical protein
MSKGHKGGSLTMQLPCPFRCLQHPHGAQAPHTESGGFSLHTESGGLSSHTEPAGVSLHTNSAGFSLHSISSIQTLQGFLSTAFPFLGHNG